MKTFIKSLLLLILVTSLVQGCTQSAKPSSKPVELQWGNAGTQPTEVWQNYNWTISRSK